MSALEWLRERQEQSERNRRLFENRPNTLRAGEVATHSMIPASQAWGGYIDKPGATWTNPDTGLDVNYGGQQLMVRQPQPEVKNKLVQKRGEDTFTKEWVSTLNASAHPNNRLPPSSPIAGGNRVRVPWDFKRGPQRPPQTIRELASGYARQPRATIPQPRSTMPEAVRASEGPSMEVLPGESIEEARLRIFGRGSPESTPRETWGGDLNLTMPQHPRTRRWIQDPASILNIGNLIKKMGGTIDHMKGIDDRIRDNRDRRFRMFQGDPYSPVRKY